MGKNRLNIPNITGNMKSIIRCVFICEGSADGTWLIFCWTYMLIPDVATRMNPSTLCARIGSTARSMPRNCRLTGTTVFRKGSQP